jgi:serine/threonine protein phosphatase PrpC
VTEPEIAGTLQAETNPEKAAEKLVALANENGGTDNVTVIVIRVNPNPGGWFSWLRSLIGSPRHANNTSNANSNGSAGGSENGQAQPDV